MKEHLQARFNYLEFMARTSSPEALQETQHEIERLQAENRDLRQQSGRLAAVEAELARVQKTIKARDLELAGLRREEELLQEEVARLRDEVEWLRGEMSRTHEPVSAVSVTAPSAASAVVASLTVPLSDGADVTARPKWFEVWQGSRGFDSEEAVVRTRGLPGLCLRPSLVGALVGKGFVGDGTTVWRALKRLQDRGLVEQKVPETEARGKAAHFYWLSDKGRQAFQLLYGQEPVESEYHLLKARHKGHEHIALNLQARDVFVAREATVDLYPWRVVIQGEFYHDPDLVLVFPGED